MKTHDKTILIHHFWLVHYTFKVHFLQLSLSKTKITTSSILNDWSGSLLIHIKFRFSKFRGRKNRVKWTRHGNYFHVQGPSSGWRHTVINDFRNSSRGVTLRESLGNCVYECTTPYGCRSNDEIWNAWWLVYWLVSTLDGEKKEVKKGFIILIKEKMRGEEERNA